MIYWLGLSRDNASPDIPLSFKFGGTEYALHSNSNVRQSYKTMTEHDSQASILPENADLVMETILDSSTNEIRTLCKARQIGTFEFEPHADFSFL